MPKTPDKERKEKQRRRIKQEGLKEARGIYVPQEFERMPLLRDAAAFISDDNGAEELSNFINEEKHGK